MPLAVRSSVRRRRKNPDEKLPERPGESSDQVMAPTRMRLRVRRRENATEGASGGDGQQQEEEEERSRGSNRRKNNTSTAAATSSSSPPSSSATSASARAMMAAEETSPDSKCPICLDRFNNLAYLDRCLHRFCFPCIQEWSHNKAECPLCKQPFASILHSVRAEDDFKEYTLRPAPANSSVAATVAMVAAMASAARSDHQMRLMLRRHREEEGGESTTRRRRRERGGTSRRARVWQWYLDSPPLALPPLPHPSEVAAEDSEEGEELEDQRRGGADLSERGVIFEGLTGLGGAVAPLAPTDRASRRLMTRLAARQRLQREGGTVRRLRERETIAFRRALYRCGVRVRSVAGNGNQGQQQRDITAENFRRNPVHLNRLRPWLRRELTVLYGAHGSLVDIVQRIIMARLARHGLEDTPTIEEELRPFLLARTDHFLHELVSFARSPLSLENYDLQAVYEPPDATLEVDGTSSSSDSSSVIAISEGEEEEGGRTEEIPLRREGGTHDDVIQTGSCLSLSAWDDETPGPSYSTAEPSCSLSSLQFSPTPREAANEKGGEKREEQEEEAEECLIVGYKKPIAERTPELVQLSSDTEEEAEDKKEEKAKETLPDVHSLPPPVSFSPTIPPSTSGACREEGAQTEKDKEAGRCRSWSGSSGRSRNSVCLLSPEMPREGEKQREGEKKHARGEKRRRRKRSRRGSERKSGTLYNPNRSIYPALMRPCLHSSSPLHSSADSASPLPPSPPDSTVSYHCSQASPFTSSVSSPCSSSPSSSSPLFSSPQLSSQTPPTPSLSPSYHSNSHHREKPGGKRKYKSRHLDSDDKDPTWRPSSSQRGEGVRRRERREKEKQRRTKEGGRRRERASRGDSCSSRKRREDRSPSVEIIYEGTIDSSTALPPARKRHRKRHRRTQLNSSPIIITLDSDSSHDNLDVNNHSSSSSPLSSQQTVDFCDLPPLPLMPSAGVGGTLNSEIGELPADILDQGSDGSEMEPVGPAAGTIAVDNSDDEVDVENVEESDLMTRSAEEKGPKRGREEGMETTRKTRTGGDDVSTSTGVNCGAPRTHTEDVPLDSHLLATILNDLKGITAPSFETSTSLDSGRTHSWDLLNKEDQLAEKRQPDFSDEKRSKDIRDQNLSSSSSSLPLLERQEKAQVQHESRDIPPLLKKASPIQSHNRNTPPPLKHKDAGSPHLLPIPSIDLQTSGELPGDNQVIPPISTLKRHFNSSLKGLTQHLSSTSNSSTIDFHSNAPLEMGALAVHSKRDKQYIDSSSGSQIRAHFHAHADLNSFYPTNSSEVPVGHRAPSIDFQPLHSLPPVDFQSKAGCSKEKPAHSNSTSRGCQVTPVILHPSSRDSGEGTPAGGDVFSGTQCNETSRPVCVLTTDSRTQNPASPVDSHSQKFPPAGESSMPTTGASDRVTPINVLSGGPKCSMDLFSFSEASEVPIDAASSYKRSPPINLHFTTPDKIANNIFNAPADQCLNHTPFASTTFQTQHRKQGSLLKPITDSQSNPHHTDDSKAFNHTEQTSDPQPRNKSWSEQNPNIDSHPQFPPTMDSHPKPHPTTDCHPPSWPAINSLPKPQPTIDSHPKPHPTIDSHPQSQPTVDSHPKPHPTIDSHPQSQLTNDSHSQFQPPVESHSKILDFQNSTDNHIPRQTAENYHNSHSSSDSHSSSQSPVDECSSSSFWKTHTRLK